MPDSEVKKSKKIIALEYDPESQSAPKMVAKAQGELAERLLDIARYNNIPLYEDPELVSILSKLDVGKEIDADLYQAVAEVLIFIYKVNQKKMQRFNDAKQQVENAVSTLDLGSRMKKRK